MSPSGAAFGWASGDVRAGDVTLRVHRAGTAGAPPLVLAHGFSDDGRCWTRFAEAVVDRFDIVAPDARNHGGSARGPADHDLLAADLAGVVDALGLRSVTLVGHSLGASTAALVAAQRPTLVGRLVLEDPPWRVVEAPPDAGRLDVLRAWIDGLAGMPDDELVEVGRRQHPTWSEADLVPWAAAKRGLDRRAVDHLRPSDWRSIAGRLRCAALVVTGDGADAIVDPASAAAIASTAGRIDVVRLSGAGHNVRREAFDAYVDAVLSFIDE